MYNEGNSGQQSGGRRVNATELIAGILGVVVTLIIGITVLLFRDGCSWVLIGCQMLLLVSVFILIWIRNRLPDKKDLLDQLNESHWRIQQIQLQKRQEQLNALQSQINPHFLYNTLDTIRGLAIERDSTEIAGIVAALASMFKYSMDYASTTVTISDELAHLEQYISIQRMRFADRFVYEVILDCDDTMLYRGKIPKMTLQPIVENAISHGLRKVSFGGRITLRLIQSDIDFKLVISDNGCGIDDEMVRTLNHTFYENRPENEMESADGFGLALTNIDLRIKISCGYTYGLQIASTPNLGTDVTIRLPALEVES